MHLETSIPDTGHIGIPKRERLKSHGVDAQAMAISGHSATGGIIGGVAKVRGQDLNGVGLGRKSIWASVRPRSLLFFVHQSWIQVGTDSGQAGQCLPFLIVNPP